MVASAFMVALEIIDISDGATNPAFAADAHRIYADLVRQGAAIGGWIDPPSKEEVSHLLGQLTARSRVGDAAVCAAYFGTTLVGLGSWRRYERPTHRSNANLERIAVDSGWQGQGIGRALTARLIATARASNVEVLTLDARGDNKTALDLYKSLGFREYGRIREFVTVGSARYDKVCCALYLRDDAGGAIAEAAANNAVQGVDAAA
jgi:ribosomal protein S18 acetylase RimI-like enzyme